MKWIGELGATNAGCLGLFNIAPARPLWDFPLPPDAPDDYQLTSVEDPQEFPVPLPEIGRDSCSRGSIFLGTVADLSLFGRMLPPDTDSSGTGEELKVGIWFGQSKAGPMRGLPTPSRPRNQLNSPRFLKRTSIRSDDFLRVSVLFHEKLGGRSFRFEQESSGGHFTRGTNIDLRPAIINLSDPAKFPTGARVARTVNK